MYQYSLVVLLTLTAIDIVSAKVVLSENEVINDLELKLAFVVNRHGERTPDSDELSLSDRQEELKNLTWIEGLEGLTNIGKRRAYQIGKFLKQRYGSRGHRLVSNIYLKDDIAVRSTDKERTKMTALVAMAALYPPEVEQQWDEGIGKIWQPVPYTAEPLSYDYLRYYSSCNYFKSIMEVENKKSIQEEFKPYEDLIPIIFKETGKNFTQNPVFFQTLLDLFRSQATLGLDIPKWAKPYLSRLKEAAKLGYRLYFRTEEMKKIGGGVMLSDFMNTATDIIYGRPVKKHLRLFSAHDFNIGALMDVTKVAGADHIMPEYGALFAIELYRSRSSGEYLVLPLYLPQAGESVAQELNFTACPNDHYCSFEKLKESSKEYLLEEKEFHRLCK